MYRYIGAGRAGLAGRGPAAARRRSSRLTGPGAPGLSCLPPPVTDEPFAFYVLAGFAAQLIDGTLGMAYGVSASTLLLGMGVPPAVTSATVHAAECVTTGASAVSHHAFGNVDRSLFRRLVIPGVLGAEESLADESFEDGLLEYPQYTKPREWEGRPTPDVLMSGDHKKIAEWRRAEAERITRARRPDLLVPKAKQ